MIDPSAGRSVPAVDRLIEAHRRAELSEAAIAAADDAATVAAPDVDGRTAGGVAAVDLRLPLVTAPADAVALTAVLAARRTQRATPDEPLELAQLGWLLHHAARSDAQGRRPHPSAGARYALRLDVVALRCDSVPPGVHRYEPAAHGLRTTARADVAPRIEASFGRAWVAAARAVLVLGVDLAEATAEHDARGYRYALIEAGHLAQNLLLLAAAAELPACPLGGFADGTLTAIVGGGTDEVPLYAVAL